MIIHNELSVEQVDRLKDLLKYECSGFSFNATIFKENNIEIWIMYPDFLIIYLSGLPDGRPESHLKLCVQNSVLDNYEKILYNLDRIQTDTMRQGTTLFYGFKVNEIKIYSRHIQVFNDDIESRYNEWIQDGHILLKSDKGNVLISMDEGINGSIYLRFDQKKIEDCLDINHMNGYRNQFNTLRLTMRCDEVSGKIEMQSPGGEPNLE